MHYLAPFPIMIGVLGVICGLLWLFAAGAENDGGPDSGLFFIFGMWYIAIRVMKELAREPMSVLPAFGILAGSAGLIWLGVVMWRGRWIGDLVGQTFLHWVGADILVCLL